MFLARVVGTVVASRKDPGLTATTLLVIQPLTTDRKPSGKALVAVDSVGNRSVPVRLRVSAAAAKRLRR